MSSTLLAELIVSVGCAKDEVAGSCPGHYLACGMHTGLSVQVGSLYGVLLAHSWSLSQRLHTTRHRLSTPLRCSQDTTPDTISSAPLTAYHQRRCGKTYRRSTMVMGVCVTRYACGLQVETQHVHLYNTTQ